MIHLPQLGRNLVLLLATMAIALAVVELCLRLLAPQQLVLMPPDLFVPDDHLGFSPRPYLDAVINTGEREVRLITGANGHRIGTAPRTNPAHRILALGDS